MNPTPPPQGSKPLPGIKAQFAMLKSKVYIHFKDVPCFMEKSPSVIAIIMEELQIEESGIIRNDEMPPMYAAILKQRAIDRLMSVEGVRLEIMPLGTISLPSLGSGADVRGKYVSISESIRGKF